MASCSGRNLTGWRTESDWVADGIRSGGGRNLMAEGALSGGTLRGCTCLKCTNRAAPTKLHQPSRRGESVPQNTQNTQNILAEKCLPQIGTDAHRLGGYGIPAIPTLPITQPNIREFREIRGENTTTLVQQPLQHQQSKQRECPTEYAEHTEHSGEESLPQIDTDAHRLGGYGIPAIPTLPITQPNYLWKSVKSVGEYYHAGAAASAAPTKQTERVSHRTR